jgi:hypothetical protein
MPASVFAAECGEAILMWRALKLAENGQGLHANADIAAAMSAWVVARCTDFPAELEALRQTTARELSDGRIERCNELGQRLRELYEHRLAVVEIALRLLGNGGPAGEALYQARDRLIRFGDDLEVSWPFFSQSVEGA